MQDGICGLVCFPPLQVGWCLDHLVGGVSTLLCWVSLGSVNTSATSIAENCCHVTKFKNWPS